MQGQWATPFETFCLSLDGVQDAVTTSHEARLALHSLLFWIGNARSVKVLTSSLKRLRSLIVDEQTCGFLVRAGAVGTLVNLLSDADVFFEESTASSHRSPTRPNSSAVRKSGLGTEPKPLLVQDATLSIERGQMIGDACHCLDELCSFDCTDLLSHKGIDALLTIVKLRPERSESNRHVVLSTLTALSGVTSFEEVRRQLADRKAALLVADVLQRHLNDDEMWTIGCKALRCICYGHATQKALLVEGGFLRFLTSKLSKSTGLGDDLSQQILGMFLALSTEAALRKAILSTHSAINSSCTVVQASSSSHVMREGAGLLRCLAFKSVAGRRIVIESGGVAVLLGILTRTTDVGALQEAAGALMNIAADMSGQDELLHHADFLPTFSAVLRKVNDAGLHEVLLGCLRNVAFKNEVSKKAMIESSLLPSVVTVLGSQDDLGILLQGCGLLHNLTYDSTAGRKAVLEAQAMPMLIHILKPTQRQEILVEAAGALDNMLCLPSSAEPCLALNGMNVLKSVLAKSSSSRLRDSCEQAMGRLSNWIKKSWTPPSGRDIFVPGISLCLLCSPVPMDLPPEASDFVSYRPAWRQAAHGQQDLKSFSATQGLTPTGVRELEKEVAKDMHAHQFRSRPNTPYSTSRPGSAASTMNFSKQPESREAHLWTFTGEDGNMYLSYLGIEKIVSDTLRKVTLAVTSHFLSAAGDTGAEIAAPTTDDGGLFETLRLQHGQAENINDVRATFGPDRSAALALAQFGSYDGFEAFDARFTELRQKFAPDGLCIAGPAEDSDLSMMHNMFAAIQGCQAWVYNGCARRVKTVSSFAVVGEEFREEFVWACPSDPRNSLFRYFSDRSADIFIVYYTGASHVQTGAMVFTSCALGLQDLLVLWRQARNENSRYNASARLVIILDCNRAGAWADELAAMTDPIVKNVSVQASCRSDNVSYVEGHTNMQHLVSPGKIRPSSGATRRRPAEQHGSFTDFYTKLVAHGATMAAAEATAVGSLNQEPIAVEQTPTCSGGWTNRHKALTPVGGAPYSPSLSLVSAHYISAARQTQNR